MRAPNVTLRISSRLADVPLLGTLVSSLCASANLSRTESSHVEVCVVEAVNNSIEHAYRGEPGHMVDVAVTMAPGEVIFDVIDYGASADPSVMCADHSEALEMDFDQMGDVPEGGRGLAIMHALMDSFEYIPATGRNCLRLTKKRTVQEG
jgi:serine/threonine-protein kinase RsbW